MPFLLSSNILPYIALAAGAYFFIQSEIKHDIEMAGKQAEIELGQKNQGDIQAYNELRFNELEKVKQSEWKEGKHAKTIYYTID